MLIHPDKSRGQNFLKDKNILAKIIDAGELKSSDTVLEIGAGTGVLTAELAKQVKKVVSFEIDKKLIPVLQENLKDFDNVEIFNESILECHPRESGDLGKSGSLWIPACAGMTDAMLTKYKLIANIPYNITSAILEKFLSVERPPELIVLLVQKEVAERVCANPGEMSILSVMAQYYGEPKIIACVPPSAFWPVPKVDSAILKIVINRHPELVSGSHEMLKQVQHDAVRFFSIVKAGFSQRRKMLKNNLRALGDEKIIAAAMRKAGIGEKARAQELTVEQWVDLAKKFDTHL